ncbi:MAG: hypothetical protein KAS38_09610, partial [Anaerolineales bacterium]|nr:hypothetical protein [Anaerolineales bacterium]
SCYHQMTIRAKGYTRRPHSEVEGFSLFECITVEKVDAFAGSNRQIFAIRRPRYSMYQIPWREVELMSLS